MDLKSESSALEYVEDNEGNAYYSKKLLDSADVETAVGTNGIHILEKRDSVNGNVNVNLDYGISVEAPSVVTGKSSPAPSSPSLSPSPGGTKGRGLRKWRRIKRDVGKEGGSNVDASKLLKRGFSNSGANSNKPMPFSGGTKQNSEGSVSSTNAFVRSPANGFDRFGTIGDSRVGAGVGNGNDSENSEDQSSKSSTAASGPKMAGYTLEKNRMGYPSVKNLGNALQQGQTGKSRVVTSKKLRGEVVKIEKENSHSSMESDSRSSFMQGLNSVTSNGRQSGRSQNYDEENSDEAQGSTRQPSEEPQVGSSGKNGVALEDNDQEELAADSSWHTKEGENEDTEPSRDGDPLLDSISSLQLVKEALEKEIQEFMKIGKEDGTPDDSGRGGSNDLDFLEPELINLKQKVLESKLDDAEASSNQRDDLQTELESLFKQKIEAEVEYLAMSGKVQNLKVSLVDQIAVLEKQKAEQSEILSKLEVSEVKAAKLKVEADKLETYCKDIASTDETIELKTSVYKYTSCFIIQLMLLLTIILLFIWQFLPSYSKVVPT